MLEVLVKLFLTHLQGGYIYCVFFAFVLLFDQITSNLFWLKSLQKLSPCYVNGMANQLGHISIYNRNAQYIPLK